MARDPQGRHPADQVVRRNEFEARHPDVTISYRPGVAWAGVVPIGGGEETITAFELGELLDRLEILASGRGLG
jgi:hypothetical protein